MSAPGWGQLNARLDSLPERMAASVNAIRDRARDAEEQRITWALAERLGVNPELYGLDTLLALVAGARAIADAAMATTGDTDEERRTELLRSFGVAQEWAQVTAAAQSLGLAEALNRGELAEVAEVHRAELAHALAARDRDASWPDLIALARLRTYFAPAAHWTWTGDARVVGEESGQ